MILWIADDHHAAPDGFHIISFRNIAGCVVGPLRVKIGPYLTDEGTHIPLGKYDYRVYIRESSQYLRSLRGRYQRTAFSF